MRLSRNSLAVKSQTFGAAASMRRSLSRDQLVLYRESVFSPSAEVISSSLLYFVVSDFQEPKDYSTPHSFASDDSLRLASSSAPSDAKSILFL
jgi:hypothetical protein